MIVILLSFVCFLCWNESVILVYVYLVKCCICRYLALEGMCLLATSEFSHDAVKKHMETVITALKVCAVVAKIQACC